MDESRQVPRACQERLRRSRVTIPEPGRWVVSWKMKRSNALARLSCGHHQALVIARVLLRATDKSAAPAACLFVEFLDQHESVHFAVAESVLLRRNEQVPRV